MSDADVVVIGAGVIGLACAAELARAGREVIVLESLAGPGRETTSRNSEVIHAGLYYPPGSLKALTCVEGRQALYARAAGEGIGHRRTGKLVVATADAELERLSEILARARENGAGDLELIDAAELRRREPRVRGEGALWSPESGIIDAHALCSSYQAEAESAGTQVVFHTEVVALEHARDLWSVVTRAHDGEEFRIAAPRVVNAAGLRADHVAALAGVDVAEAGWALRYCKGDYFAVAPALGELTRHLVYPVPVPGGLGIHVTVDLAGRFRLGPDVEWVDRVRYDVDGSKAQNFARAAGRYLPELRAADLSPDFAGIRPKLVAEGEPPGDFVIEECSARGAPGLITLLGIESPGLTASPAIARRVSALVSDAA